MSKITEIQERYGNIDFIDMIHTFLTNENIEGQKKRVKDGRLGKFYPSSIGRCRRSIVYQMLGYPEKSNRGQSLLIMENGTSFHNRMEHIFEKMGIMVAPELSLKDDELRISGRSDAIIWNFLKTEEEEDGEEIVLYDAKDPEKEIYRGPSNHILIVELKSIKNKNYEKLPKSKPKKEHEMQLQLYFYLTGIRKGMVYYENKDTQESKYYIVEYNEQLVQEVIEDIRFVVDYAQRGELPEREGNALDIMCRYCNFRNICHLPISEEEWQSLYFEESETSK